MSQPIHPEPALTDHLCIHFFELPKFRLSEGELTTPLHIWLYFLKRAEQLDPNAVPKSLDIPEIRQAMEALIMLGQSDIDREIYEARLKARRDENSRLYGAREEGLRKGLKKGRQESLQRGEAAMLLRLMERRFGTLDESQRQTVLTADPDKLHIWGDRLLDAQRWEQVVEDP